MQPANQPINFELRHTDEIIIFCLLFLFMIN